VQNGERNHQRHGLRCISGGQARPVGPETEEQLRQLRLLGCDEMQGYLYGKPVPVESFEQKYMSLMAHQ